MKSICAPEQTRKAALFTLKFFVFTVIFTLCTVGYIYVFRSCGAETPPGDGNISVLSVSGSHFIIDAGHGGIDGGASAANGTHEKELNLALSFILRDILDIMGYDVVMTRTEDLMLSDGGSGSNKLCDLRTRINIAKANPDAILISIHMNKYPDTRISGLQVWYSPNHPLGQTTARFIQNDIKTYIAPHNNRKIKKADSNIYILDRIHNPAVLVECGFLSNVREAEQLSDDTYRRKLALVIAVAASHARSERDQSQTDTQNHPS